jgi:hypothetical protein
MAEANRGNTNLLISTIVAVCRELYVAQLHRTYINIG